MTSILLKSRSSEYHNFLNSLTNQFTTTTEFKIGQKIHIYLINNDFINLFKFLSNSIYIGIYGLFLYEKERILILSLNQIC